MIKNTTRGVSGGPGGRVLPCNAGDTGSSLAHEDPTEPGHHSYQATATTEPMCLEPMLHNKKSPLTSTRASPCKATKTQCSQKSKNTGNSLGVQ